MSAQKLANDLFNGGLVVMLLTLVTSLGMTFSVRQILAPLKNLTRATTTHSHTAATARTQAAAAAPVAAGGQRTEA